MLAGTVLLGAALLALALAFTTSVQALRRPDDRLLQRAVRSTWLAFALLFAALFVLAVAFLIGDLSIAYVWRNVDLRYPWYQRLSGLWVGREGSLLLWTTMTLGFWSLEEWRHDRLVRRDPAEAIATALTAHERPPGRADPPSEALDDVERIRRIARVMMLGVVLLLAAVVLLYQPFIDTTAADLELGPQGRGVNPQLIIAFNAIHPPILFTGYALTGLVTAFAVGHLVTGRPGWVGPARRWGHLAFLFLTLGVGLGGLWAYIALGWGGYWAWDPVEVGSIVPWIAVTAFLHAGYRQDGKGEFPVAAPALAFLALPAALLSTFIVRAGGVWVSVHSFLGPGDAASAWGRYLSALRTQYEVQVYSFLLALAVLGLLALVSLHVRRLENQAAATKSHATPAKSLGPLDRLLRTLTLRNLFVVGVLLLTLLGTVTVTVLFLGVNGFASDAVREQVFTERTGPIALAAVLVMSLAITIGVLRRRLVLGFLGTSLAIGIVAALVWQEHWALASATPVLATAAVLAAYRVVHAWRRQAPRTATRSTGIHLIHVGVALVFLGHGFVSTFEEFHEPVALAPGESRDVGPYTLRLDRLDTADTDDNGRIDLVTAAIALWEGDTYLGTVDSGYHYYDFMFHYKPDVGVGRFLDRDVYFAPAGIHDPDQGWIFGNLPLIEQGASEAAEVDGIAVQVATLPYINLVWGGASLMVLGAALLSWSSWTTARPRAAARPSPAPTPA